MTSAFAVLTGCSGEAKCRGDSCGAAGTPSADAGMAVNGADVRIVQADQACSAESVRAMRGAPKPVDIIFVIDNSASMGEEIAAVRTNINQAFAALIAENAVDYRVIMLSHYGRGALDICIEPPLAQADCSLGVEHTNSGVYFHYDQDIQSTDALCQLLATFDQPDTHGLAPQGWQAWLRPEANKALVLISDDSPRCTYHGAEKAVSFGVFGLDPFEDALTFHEALLARSPAQFGVPPEVKYQFFSIVGLAAKPDLADPYFPHDPIVAESCDSAPAPGPTYQALSIITDALRYPVCEGRSFDSVFRVLARRVIADSQADCEFALPEPGPEQVFDLASVNLEYRPGDGSAPQRFTQVESLSACKTPSQFYIGDRIRLCPSACTLVKRDAAPEVEVLFGCTYLPR